MVRESPIKIASWLHQQHPKFRPLALSLSRLVPSIIMSAAFVTSFFNFEISNYIGISGAFLMMLISIVSACLKVQQTKDENTALVKTFDFVKKKIDRKTKLGVKVSNKDISDLLGTFCEMTLQREAPVEMSSEIDNITCTGCDGKGCSKCAKKTRLKTHCCAASHFGVILTILKAIRTVVNDFVPGWLLMTYVKDLQRIYSLEQFSASGSTRLESWHSFTDFEKAIEILEACGIFIGLLSNCIYTFVHCFQLCRCGICKVRGIEDRIKKIGRNPICRDDTEVSSQKNTLDPSTKYSETGGSETDDIDRIDINKLNIDEEENETIDIGLDNKAFEVTENEHLGTSKDAVKEPISPQESSKDHTNEGTFPDDIASQTSVNDVIHVKMCEDNISPTDSQDAL